MTLCAPCLNSLALLSVGAPLIITIAALGAVVVELLDEALALELADLLVVERDVVVDVGVRDQAVVADHRNLRLLRAGHDRAGRRGVHRVEHEHLRALGDGGLSLLLLLGRVLVGVRVDDLAVRAELLRPWLRSAAGPATRSGRSSTPAAAARSSRSSRHRYCHCFHYPSCCCRRHRTPRAPVRPTSAKITPTVLSLSILALLLPCCRCLLDRRGRPAPCGTCLMEHERHRAEQLGAPSELTGDDLHVLRCARNGP